MMSKGKRFYRIVGEVTHEAVAHHVSATSPEAAVEKFKRSRCDMQMGFVCNVEVKTVEEEEPS
jgi:hypothetical protein